MRNSDLHIRVDPPYEGESLSSFVGRAAQFYGMPLYALLGHFIKTKKGVSAGWMDMDFNPPVGLEDGLAESVSGWRSPVDGHQGFYGWILGNRCRHAYCPLCFEEDLKNGRTPYFRRDWAPVFVGTCWKHGTLLFPWHSTDCQGLRLLPKMWLYDPSGMSGDAPTFFRRHLEWSYTGRPDGGKVYGDLTLVQATGYLATLQLLVEKTSAASMPHLTPSNDQGLRVRELAKTLVRTAAREIWDVHPLSRFREFGKDESEELDFVPMPPKRWPPGNTVESIRQTRNMQWRRTYLLFAARTLAGTEEFAGRFADLSAPSPRWKEWWREGLLPRMGLEHAAVFEQLINGYLARRLDGLNWPGRHPPSYASRLGRSARRFGRHPKSIASPVDMATK